MTGNPTTVGGRYELGELLGRGGMAEVRRAVDRRLGRPVAVKQLRADLAVDPTFQARFRREAQSAAGLNHPTIVAVYDTGEETDPLTGTSIPYIVMELVEGPTLRDVLRDGRKILPERALELTQGVLDALSYSHKAGIIHRDIKPANVMLTQSGAVKVMDFGIARAVADTSATMTQTAAVIGTAQYLSPEQARGETVDARSDIYSAGCLLYELLVGRPPFVGESPVSVAYQHVREAPVPPSQLDPVITPDIDAVTLKALAKDPADRYQSAREMKADLARVLAGQQTTAVVPLVGDTAATRVVAPVDPPSTAPTYEDLEDRGRTQEPRRAGHLDHGGDPGCARHRLVRALSDPHSGDRGRAAGRRAERADLHRGAGTGPARVARAEGRGRQGERRGGDQGPDHGTGPGGRHLGRGQQHSDDHPERGTEDRRDPRRVGRQGRRRRGEDTGGRLDFTNVKTVAAKSEDPGDKPNEVVKISPKEGSTVALDAEITVTYATGESEVPNFVGLTASRARDLADQAGFPDPSFTERESDEPEGTVIDQSPNAGKKVDRGTAIKLTLAKEPEPEPDPDPDPTPTPTETTTDAQPNSQLARPSATLFESIIEFVLDSAHEQCGADVIVRPRGG